MLLFFVNELILLSLKKAYKGNEIIYIANFF